MTTKDIELTILTPQRSIFAGRVASLVVPAHDGYLGIMTGHAPFICLLQKGQITARAENQSYRFSTSGGLLEVLANKITILADNAEPVAAPSSPANR